MTDWTSGYVADIGYTYGYYADLNPRRASLLLPSAGIAAPTIRNACELGFGQGISVNMHAAASETEWWGTDFNPTQAGFARELVSASGASARLSDRAFADFCADPDLPEFEFIGLHGIWSWISDRNREILVDFMRRKLAVGGVLYISYNTLPGWSAFAPMRHLMTEHATVVGSGGGGTLRSVESAIGFAEQLLALKPAYAAAHPQVAERVAQLKTQNSSYLAHEYFNRDWHPMHFGTIADWLEEAKLTFAVSENPLDQVDPANLTDEQRQFLASISNASLRETARDFIVNQQFRRDYWIKGARRLTPLEQREALEQMRLVLITHRPDVPMTFQGARGECTMKPELYGAVLDALADHQPCTLGDLYAATAQPGISFADVHEAVLVLCGTGHLAPAQSDSEIDACSERVWRLNDHLMRMARSHRDMYYLASPVTGGGISISCFQQLFLAGWQAGANDAEQFARHVWEVLCSQDQKIIKDGKPLTTEEENLSELRSQAEEFESKRLDVVRALRLVPPRKT